MEISTYAYSSKGRRANNEDACGFSNEERVWVVADGLGGHTSGEIASKIAVSYILQAARCSKGFTDDEIVTFILGANERLVTDQKSNPLRNGMRTTIVAAFASDNKMKYIHVGDSRFYYFKNGRVFTQTKDHSVPQMAVQIGELTADQIRFHDDRNKLLKVLGGFEDLGLTAADGEINLEIDDAFLLCTDGFWEFIFEPEMEIDLLKAYTPRAWADNMISRILVRLTEKSDNFTVICGFVN